MREFLFDDYEDLYNIDLQDTPEEKIEDKFRDKIIKRFRIKTIKSGQMLESEIYPIFKTKPVKRDKKKSKSRKAQKNLNDKNTKKHVTRLINTNFTDADTWATLTYDADNLPATVEDAKRDMQNYIRRLKRQCKKQGLPELKYIYVTEYREGEEKKRVHHHIVLNVKDRDLVEDTWQRRGRTQARRLQADDYGYEGLARYITKDVTNTKRYSASRNLDKPIIKTADSKMTKRRAEKIARHLTDTPALFEKMYQSYTFNDITVKYSDIVSGAYIYVRMKKKEGKNGRKNKSNLRMRTFIG